MNCSTPISWIMNHPSNCQNASVFDMITHIALGDELHLLKVIIWWLGKIQDGNIIEIYALRYVYRMLKDFFHVDDLKQKIIVSGPRIIGTAIHRRHFGLKIILFCVGDAMSSGNNLLVVECRESSGLNSSNQWSVATTYWYAIRVAPHMPQ